MLRAVVVVMSLLGAAGSVLASDAEDLIGQGIELRRANRDQEALPLFQRALEKDPKPRAFAQLGTCEQALGLWIGAETHLGEALKHPEDAWIQKNDQALRAALAFVQQRLGSIHVWGSPAGARISIGGELVATLPMSQPARAVAGRRTVTVEAPGFLSESLAVEVVAGESIREHVVLRPTAVPPPQQQIPTLAVPTEPDKTPSLTLDSRDGTTPPEGTRFYKRWWFWTAVGTVAIAAVATIYLVSHRNGGCSAPMGGVCTNF